MKLDILLEKLETADIAANTNRVYSHIPHLEDLVLMDPSGFASILEEITNGKCIASIKYDGMPCVFFGKDLGGEAFVATKSILGKTKKMCKNKDDIKTHFGSIPELEQKLNECLTRTKTMDISAGNVYQSDLLGVNVDPTTTSVKPNVVSYTFTKELKDKVASPVILLMTHSKWCFDNTLTINKVSLDTPPTSDKVMCLVPEFISNYQYDCTNVCVSCHHTSKVSESVYKSINGCIRDGTDPTSVVPVNLQEQYKHGIELKNKLYEDLMTRLTPKYLIPNIQSVCEGEGFVVMTESGKLCKIVNRPVFAKENFKLNKNMQ